MAWSAIADKVSSWTGKTAPVNVNTGIPDQSSTWTTVDKDAEIIVDPEFDDPSAWSLFGSSAITGGQLVFTAANSNLVLESDSSYLSVGGASYRVTVVVASTDVTPIAATVGYGNSIVWNSNIDGAGTHTKTIVALESTPIRKYPLVISAGNGPSGYNGVFDSVSVIRLWDSVTDETTSWS